MILHLSQSKHFPLVCFIPLYLLSYLLLTFSFAISSNWKIVCDRVEKPIGLSSCRSEGGLMSNYFRGIRVLFVFFDNAGIAKSINVSRKKLFYWTSSSKRVLSPQFDIFFHLFFIFETDISIWVACILKFFNAIELHFGVRTGLNVWLLCYNSSSRIPVTLFFIILLLGNILI